jgi:transposase
MTLYNRFVRWAEEGLWDSVRGAGAFRGAAVATDDRLLGCESPPLGGGRKGGEKNQAIGRSRRGRTTKIRALTDENCRPVAFLITGGNVADCTAGAGLIDRLPDCAVLNADK